MSAAKSLAAIRDQIVELVRSMRTWPNLSFSYEDMLRLDYCCVLCAWLDRFASLRSGHEAPLWSIHLVQQALAQVLLAKREHYQDGHTPPQSKASFRAWLSFRTLPLLGAHFSPILAQRVARVCLTSTSDDYKREGYD